MDKYELRSEFSEANAVFLQELAQLAKEIQLIKSDLGLSYSAQGFQYFASRFQEITEIFDRHRNYPNDSYYNLIRLFNSRRKLVEVVATSASKIAKQFELYSSQPRKYSRVEIQRLLSNFVIILESLIDDLEKNPDIHRLVPVSKSLSSSHTPANTAKPATRKVTKIRASKPKMIRQIKVFLCHSSDDKASVKKIFARLKKEDNIDPWLDAEKLVGGQDWDYEIEKVIRKSDVILVCLSKKSVTKEGYVQKEIKKALDIADQKPEGTIFIIPLKLEECDVPDRLSRWQWVNYYEDGGYQKLLLALQHRANSLPKS